MVTRAPQYSKKVARSCRLSSSSSTRSTCTPVRFTDADNLSSSACALLGVVSLTDTLRRLRRKTSREKNCLQFPKYLYRLHGHCLDWSHPRAPLPAGHSPDAH